MDVFPVNWDSVPEVMNKEQFFRICHISKSTALHLLKSRGPALCRWALPRQPEQKSLFD